MARTGLLATAALLGAVSHAAGGMAGAWFGAGHFDEFKGQTGPAGPPGVAGPQGRQGPGAPKPVGGMLLVSRYDRCPEGTRNEWFSTVQIDGSTYNLCTIY
jgi:hypothetical protein